MFFQLKLVLHAFSLQLYKAKTVHFLPAIDIKLGEQLEILRENKAVKKKAWM